MRKPAEPGSPPQRAPHAAAARALPQRFYKSVTVAHLPPSDAPDGAHWRILLDDRPLRTPAKLQFCVPTRALADAIAAEWSAQNGYIDPATMPLTKLANSAIDGVRGREDLIRADIVKYAASDLLCYRADSPRELVQRQAQAWDPILTWTQATLGARFAVSAGVMPVPQTQAALATVALALEHCDNFTLAALHVLTTLLGSALLALAHARGRLSAEDAWTAAHVDEDWQIGQWGEDADAAARRSHRLQELLVASRMLTLAGETVASPSL
jgi:chaperone required for assembly of F1-ATPase